jgi:hypothetical protein
MRQWLLPLVLGIIGIAIGMVYGWIISPVEFVDTTPASLRADYRADYVLMVGESYHADRDAALAIKRLAILGAKPPATLAEDAYSAGQQAGFSQDDLALIQELRHALQAAQPVPTTAGSAP